MLTVRGEGVFQVPFLAVPQIWELSDAGVKGYLDKQVN